MDTEKNHDQGFRHEKTLTLIEFLIIITVIAILATMLLPAINTRPHLDTDDQMHQQLEDERTRWNYAGERDKK